MTNLINKNNFVTTQNLTKCVLYVLKCIEVGQTIAEVEYGDIKKHLDLQEGSFTKIDLVEGDNKLIVRVKGKEEVVDFDCSVCSRKEILIGGSLLLLFFAENVNNNFINEFPTTKIIGHRGSGKQNIYETKSRIQQSMSINQDVSELCYENTVTSFNKAFETGAKWVELDVQLTADRVPIIFHDFNLNGEPIHKISLTRFSSFFHGHSDINSLPNTLEWILLRVNKALGLNVEIKYPSHEECLLYGLEDLIPIDEYVSTIINTLKKNYNGRIMFSSFHPLVLLYLKQHLGNSKVLIAISKDKRENPIDKAISFCCEGELNGIVCDYATIGCDPEDAIMKCRQNNLKLYVYSKEVSDKQIADNLIKLGIDGLITDDIKAVLGD